MTKYRGFTVPENMDELKENFFIRPGTPGKVSNSVQVMTETIPRVIVTISANIETLDKWGFDKTMDKIHEAIDHTATPMEMEEK